MLSWCQTGKQHFWSSSPCAGFTHTLWVKAVLLPWIWSLIVQEKCLEAPWVWGITSTKFFFTLLLSAPAFTFYLLPCLLILLALLSFSHQPQFSSSTSPDTWSSSASPAGPSPGPAQHLGNHGSLLQLSPSPGARGSPLAAFPPSRACLLWLKVDGMGMVSQNSAAPLHLSAAALLSAGARVWSQAMTLHRPAGTCMHFYNRGQQGTDSFLTQSVFILNKHHLLVAVSCIFLQLLQCIW